MAITPYSSISALSYTPEIYSTQQSLTSGQRINSAADGAADSAVITAFSTQINSQDVATRNANTGISLLQTADSGSASISQNLMRMTELALQAQNGTLNTSDRAALNTEFQQNMDALNQTANNSQFNGINLLNDSSASVAIAFDGSSQNIQLADLTSTALGLDNVDISNLGNATAASGVLSTALEQLTNQRSQFGAAQNGLSSAVTNIQNQNINVQQSRSQMLDTNYAKAVSEQVRQNILQDSEIMMQAQTNQSRASVLQLLNS